MTHRQFITLSLAALFLALAPTALASTTWYVGVSGIDSNTCTSPTTACKTIGHAISLAASGDTVMVAAATYTENLTIGFGVNLKIIGSGVSTTIIDGGRVNRVLTVNSYAVVSLSKLTMRNGYSSNGDGGGVYNDGTLAIQDAAISSNVASFRGGGVLNVGSLSVINSTMSGNGASTNGGGISNSGTIRIINSTLSGNTASVQCFYSCGPLGGAIYNYPWGVVTISNSTLSGNTAVGLCLRASPCIALGHGGGIFNGGMLKINNGTLSGNYARGARGFFQFYTGPGAIANFANSGGTVAIRNSIVANNPGGNCGGVTSHGYNLSSDNTCNFSGPGDLNNTDPKLGTLGYYGGPTQTIPLLSGSPAIDAGNPSGCTDEQGNLLKTDQRGQPRPDPEDTGGCDMGSFESQND
jgi:hypothetical protein